MDQRTPPRKTAPKGNNPMATLLSSIILGVCIIIAGANIGGSVKKLTAAVEAQTFASTLNSPSTITVNNTAPKNYYTEKEAAVYLNITEDEIKAAITKGEIKEYIKTSSGYSISQDQLDDYFEQRAYNQLVANNENAQ